MGAGLDAATVLARAVGVRLSGRPTVWHDVDLGGVRGRLWSPPRDRGDAPILLAAGVTPLGVADPRVVRLADAIARTGRTTFVPELALPRHRLEEADIERLVRAVEELDAFGEQRGVGALGFSFGGSFLLLAAAEERAARRLRVLATFGAYAELTSVLQALLVRGIDPAARAAIVSALGLDETAVADLEDLVASGAPAAEVVAALPGDPSRLVQALSPLRVAGRVEVPLLVLHALDDPTVPHGELERLRRAFPHARTSTVRLFTHVDFVPTRDLPLVVRDLSVGWDFARRLLAA